MSAKQRKSFILIAALMIGVLMITACGNSNGQPGAEEEVKYDIPATDYAGEYAQERASMTIETDKDGNMTATGHGSGGADLHWEWEMHGQFDVEMGIMEYTDCTITEFVTDENGESTEKVIESDGTGCLIFRTEEKLKTVMWKDSVWNDGEPGTFTYVGPEAHSDEISEDAPDDAADDNSGDTDAE